MNNTQEWSNFPESEIAGSCRASTQKKGLGATPLSSPEFWSPTAHPKKGGAGVGCVGDPCARDSAPWALCCFHCGRKKKA